MSSMSQPHLLSNSPSTGMALIRVIIGGIIVGLLLFFSRHIIDLVIFSPMVAGLVGAILLDLLLKNYKGSAGLWLGLLMGLVIIATDYTGDYLEFRKDIADQAARSGQEMSIFDSRVDQVIEEIGGQSGFSGYMNIVIETGTTVVKMGYDFSQTQIRGEKMIILILAHAVLIIGLCAIVGRRKR